MRIKFLTEIEQIKQRGYQVYERDLNTCKIKISYRDIEIENKDDNQEIKVGVMNNKVILKSTSLELRPDEITRVINQMELVKEDIKSINETPEWLTWLFHSNQD